MEDRAKPVAGVDYPRTHQEFEQWLSDDTACRNYLFRVRWPQGFKCPRCGSMAAPWLTARGYFTCRQCQAQISVTVGTVFERSRFSLRTWYAAMWLITSQKHGVSALGVQRVLGLGSYQTAWTWLHKLRRSMVRLGRERLHGTVEVDESYVGGSEEGGKRGRGTEQKEIVAIAVEVHSPTGLGRVRMRRVADASGARLIPFVCDVVEVGSEVRTDGWGGYNDLAKHGFKHSRTVLSDSGDPAHVVMPGVHRVSSLLKRWLLSTHQGAVSGKHLDYYLDEYTFRFNRRTSRSRGLLFYRLMQQAAATFAVSYRQLVDGEHNM